MRDAFGGIVNISMIVVFLVVVSGYLAFNVSYTKAFRVKNKVITTIEQYQGNCGSGSDCEKKINAYIQQVGYSPAEFDGYEGGCSTIHAAKPKAVGRGYYIAKCSGSSNNTVGGSGSTDNKKVYYRVETAIDISIPIVNNIISNMRVFRLSGNTKLIREN